MKGFYIEVTNNLLEPKHTKQMGTAVWEFMWCLDKITLIDEEQIGWVYNKSPINLEDIRTEIGRSVVHISRNLNKLKNCEYLRLIHTPRGIIIGVNKAKKRFNNSVKPGLTKALNHSIKSVKPTTIYSSNNNSSNNTMSSKDDEEKKPFSFKEKLKSLLEDEKRKDSQIIANYWKLQGITFENGEQYLPGFKRELRPVRNLLGYPLDRILEVMRWMSKNCDFRWTLETVHKYIDYDLTKIKTFGAKVDNDIQEPEYYKSFKAKLQHADNMG